MKRNLPDTSLQAFDTIRPHISDRQREVLQALKALNGNATNQEIANFLHWPIHKVSPRTGELRKLNMIERGERTKDAYKYVLVTKEEQLTLFQ